MRSTCAAKAAVDIGLDLGERVPELVERLLVMILSKQVRLDGASLVHGAQVIDND